MGATVTGAVMAVGATLFATRDQWLPRAKKFSAWFEDSVQDQLGNLAPKRSGKASRSDTRLPVPAADLDASGADAGFEIGAAAH